MDKTYIKVSGRWVYLYRAVDRTGWTVDFFLSRNRDVNAAKTFLRDAIKNRRTPTKITLDAYAASHRAVMEMKEAGELPRRVKVRSSQYFEQSHRTGPPASETTGSADARIQAIRPRRGNDFGNRASREDQEGTVQDGEARRVQCDDVGTMERGVRCLSLSQFISQAEPNRTPYRPEFAPKPEAGAFCPRPSAVEIRSAASAPDIGYKFRSAHQLRGPTPLQASTAARLTTATSAASAGLWRTSRSGASPDSRTSHLERQGGVSEHL